MNEIKPAEKRWVLIFALCVMVITTIPYFIAYFHQGQDWVFSGFLFGVEDGNSYIAKMLSGANGAWLFRTPYTAYPQAGFLAFFPYLLLGKLTSPPGQHEQLVALFHLYRWAGSILMILATYKFISIFIEDVKLRRLGLAIAALGGGLGFLSVIGLQGLWKSGLPLEFYSPESFGFLSIFGIPHIALGRALLLFGLCVYILPSSNESITKKGIIGGILWLLLGFLQPLTILIGWAVIGFHFILLYVIPRTIKNNDLDIRVRKSYVKKAVWMAAISSPMVIYNFLAFQLDPYLKEWALQNLIFSPPPLEYLLAYGLLLPFAIVGANKLVNNLSNNGLLLLGWLILFPILAYAPYNLQRRLPEGIWVVLTLLAMIALAGFSARLKKGLTALTFVSFLTTAFILAGSGLAIQKPGLPLFRSAHEIEAFKFLAEAIKPGDVVLAGYDTSNALPAWVPVYTLIGHGPESIHLAELRPKVESIFRSQTTDQERTELLREFHVNYLFRGPQEATLGGWDPISASYLKSIYSKNGYDIFEVKLLEVQSGPAK